MKWIALISCLLGLSAGFAGAAEQRQEFSKPVLLTYGDPETVAPMMGPCLTVDFDHDGLDDLVEGGRWWRNTGRTREGLPIFGPAAEGGIPGSAIGDLNGDGILDVVTASHTEYRWFEDTNTGGQRRFEERGKLLFVLGTPLAPPERGEGAPSCCLADWDGDGRTDLLVGTTSVGLERYLPSEGPGHGVGWRDGSWIFRAMTATVYLHRNVGTREAPLFTAGELVTTGKTGRAITFFDQARPHVVDWNGDGKRDLLVAAFDRVLVFLNVGSGKGAPVLDDGHLLTFGGETTLPYERRSVFPFRDKAGLWHLRVGGPTVSEAVQERQGDLFSFGALRAVPFLNPEMKVDVFAVPSAADWDGDGKVDLVVGSEDGWIWFFRNLHPKGGVGRWAAPVPLAAAGRPIRLDKNACLQGPCEWLWGYSSPAVADWDGDGDLDLVCGSTLETYVWFENVGSRTAPKLAARGALRCGAGEGVPVECAWRTRPGVGDLDGDGLADLVGVAGNRQLCWWRRTRDAQGVLRLAAPAFPLDANGKPFTITGGGRATGRSVLSLCDWDRDGRLDILSSPRLGDTVGYQLFFRNLGMRDGKLALEPRPKQIRVSGHTGKWNHYLMAEPVDLDGDGQWEMLAGVDRGTLYYWRE